jgi:hypothetical protein
MDKFCNVNALRSSAKNYFVAGTCASEFSQFYIFRTSALSLVYIQYIRSNGASFVTTHLHNELVFDKTVEVRLDSELYAKCSFSSSAFFKAII